MKRFGWLSLGWLLLVAGTMSGQTIFRGPYLQSGTPTSIVVRWHTGVSTEPGRVWYGTALNALNSFADDLVSTPVSPTIDSGYEVTLTGLLPNTKYYYAVGTPAAGVIQGGDDDHSFVTAPIAGERQSMRIWVIGDSGTADDDARDVRDAYYQVTGSRETDIWLMLGDNAYRNGTQNEYQVAVFSDMYEALLQRSALFSTIGNHDGVTADSSTQSGPYYDIFTLPTAGEAGGMASGTEAYYSFDRGNVHFVCLDSQETNNAPGGAMLTWLQADLASTDQDWIVAFWHHPPYSKGSHDSDLEGKLIDMRENVLPILEAHGVDLVLCGHSHAYERSVLLDGHYGDSTTYDPILHAVDDGDGNIGSDGAYRKVTVGAGAHEGCVYVVAGSSGRESSAGDLDHPIMIHNERRLGSLIMDVNEFQLDLRFIDEGGETLDHLTLAKGGVTPVQIAHTVIAKRSSWRYEASGTDLGVTWKDVGFDDSGWSVGAGLIGFGEPEIDTLIADLNQSTVYFRREFLADDALLAADNLRLLVNHDDGYVAWLNGVEVARRSMPAGPVTYSTIADSHESGVWEAVDLTDHIGLLQSGTNLLAIEVHQRAPNSSDIVFDAIVEYDGFSSPLGVCGDGALGEDVLSINGSTGGLSHGIEVAVGAPITWELATPSTHSGQAQNILFMYIGPDAGLSETALPGALGTMCFVPEPLAPGTPGLYTLASSYAGGTGGIVSGGVTPWTLTYPPGLPVAGLSITTQAVVESQPGTLRVSNAVKLDVVP